MNEQPRHGWGFCGSQIHLPEPLFKRIVNCYIYIVYYAGVAMVGQRFDKAMDPINVDAWKYAFDEPDVTEALGHFFCDALPTNYQEVIHKELDHHPLKGIKPATIPLGAKEAKVKWNEHAMQFAKLEDEVQAWATLSLQKLPGSLPNFNGERHDEDEFDNEDNE